MNMWPVKATEGEGAIDLTGEDLFNQFPNVTEAFDVEYITTINASSGLNSTNYTNFYEQVYDYRNTEPIYPNRYGSFEIFQASKSKNIY